jgi:hypothetical protein
MAQGTTLTYNGSKGWFPTEIIPMLKTAREAYCIDARGMADGGSCLTSTFVSYCDIEEMQSAMDETKQDYKGTAADYARRYNNLFEIDC